MSEIGQQRQDDLVYAARVSLDEHQLQAADRVVDLDPGMAVTVEMKTGSRRIINYLLSPLAKYEHEALRERKGSVGSASKLPKIAVATASVSRSNT
jgi:hemolysin D